MFELQTILGVSNPRPLSMFLKQNDFYDFETKTLKIPVNLFKKEYKKFIINRRKNAYLSGARGRPRKIA